MSIDSSTRPKTSPSKIRLQAFIVIVSGCLPWTLSAAEMPILSLSRAVEIAIEHDPWHTASQARQRALEAQSQAVSGFPSPKLSVSAMNLPTDSFSFNQENMTQLSVGVSQMFPRGDTLSLLSRQLTEKGNALPLLQLDRQADVTATVSQLWLDAFKADQSIALITANRALFEQLVEIARANYASALGRTRQQDIIRAQLELTSLDDRLQELEKQKAVALQKLDGWLAASTVDGPTTKATHATAWYISSMGEFGLPAELSSLEEGLLVEIQRMTRLPQHDITDALSHHPIIQALDQNIIAATTGRELSTQQYKPEWGLTAAYSHRDNASSGMARPDFFSVGLTIDVPLLQRRQTDASVQAAAATIEAIKAERRLSLRNMRAALMAEAALIDGLSTRLSLYQDTLLPQLDEYAEATLMAYTNDESEFVEVVRARIDLLNAKISALVLAVDRRKAIARLDYFWPHSLARTESQDAYQGEQP